MKKLISLLCFLLLPSMLFANDKEKITIALDWFANPDHAPLIIAKQQGFFAKQGLDVELLGPADPNDPPKWVATGKADIAITYEPQFFEQVDQGLPLIRIGTLIDKPLNCLVALKGSGITNIGDLKGKRIGSTNGGLTSIMIKVMLAKQGLTDKDVQLINVRYNLTQALLSRQVDTVSGMMRNFEVPQLELNGHQVITFFPEDNGIPNYSELIFITHTKKVRDARFPRFLYAIKQAIAYYHTHPNETWQDFAKEYPESNNEVNHQAWLSTIPYFAQDPNALNLQEWQKFAAFMLEHQMIKKVQPFSRYTITLAKVESSRTPETINNKLNSSSKT